MKTVIPGRASINFKTLGFFLAVADNASFRKAAEQFRLSPPTVSMQIGRLEEQLGVALFHRSTRNVALTPEGEKLMISARRAMAEMESGLERIQMAASLQQGVLSLACVPTVASNLLPPLLVEFSRQYPGISLRVREIAHDGMLELIRRREVDFGIGPVPEQAGELDFAPLFTDEYVALFPKTSGVQRRGSISLRELSGMPLITLPASSLFRKGLDNALHRLDLVADLNYEFTNAGTLAAMAEAGLGVAVMPRVAVPWRMRLKAVRIADPSISRTIAVVTIRGDSLSPAADRLVQLCNQQLARSR